MGASMISTQTGYRCDVPDAAGTSFVVIGAAQTHDAALVTASAEMKQLTARKTAGVAVTVPASAV